MIGYIPKYLGAGISNRLSARTRASNFCANRTPYNLWMNSSKSNIANKNGIRINTPRTHQLEQSNRRIKKDYVYGDGEASTFWLTSRICFCKPFIP